MKRSNNRSAFLATCVIPLLTLGVIAEGVVPKSQAVVSHQHPGARQVARTPPGALDEWRMTNGDAAQSRRLTQRIKLPLKVAWRSTLLPDASAYLPDETPVASGKTLYLLSQSQIAAIDTDTGVVRWTQATNDIELYSFYAQGQCVAMPDGVVSPEYPKLTKRSVKDGRVLWQQDVGGTMGCVQLRSGHLLTTQMDTGSTGTGIVRELDANNGAILATRTLDQNSVPSPYNNFNLIRFGEMPGPKGMLFAGGGNALVTMESVTGSLHGLCYDSGPTAALPNRLFIHQKDRIWAWSSNTTRVWSREGRPAGYYHPLPTLVVTPSVVIVYDLPFLDAYATRTGHTLWGHTLPGGRENIRRPIAAGDDLYVLSQSKTAATLMVYRLRDGKQIWSLPLGRSAAWICIHQGAVYIERQLPSRSAPIQYELIKLVPAH